MKIELKESTLKQLSNGYQDNSEGGVIGYGGKLDIRPPFQREFIYKDKQRDLVIDTIKKNFPLNVMYWAVRDDGNYEVIDGQQRTISSCQYVNGDFSIDGLAFHNLPEDKQEQILTYKLTIYLCEGTPSEKLEWFKTINIAGEKLTDQELLNAIYSGPWVTDAKKYFSKTGCAAYNLGGDYMSGTAIRQDYLETVLDWIADGQIKEYMSAHQSKPDAKELWNYYQQVIEWIKVTFPNYRKEMQGIAFGPLYKEFKNKQLDPKKLEKEIVKLMQDDDVTKKSGIYEYVLTRKERCLSIRAFTPSQKRKVYEAQKGVCRKCKKRFDFAEMEADHIKPWHEGGKTIIENCEMLCKEDNRKKAGK
jgi:hypothetical protein